MSLSWAVSEVVAPTVVAGVMALLVVALVIFLFKPGGRRKRRTARIRVAELRQGGHDARLCERCQGGGMRGGTILFMHGRSMPARKACPESDGSGILLGCRECGYDLTANVSGRCPECGAPTARRRAPGGADSANG